MLATIVCGGVIGLLLYGHRSAPAAYEPEYADFNTPGTAVVFGVHPLYNPQRLHEAYGPLVTYLNQHLSGITIMLEASRSYEAFEQKLYARHFHFALPNPYQTTESLKHGYRVFGKMGDDASFRGIILVRRDRGITEISDLKGQTISFPAPTALAGTMMPLLYLHRHGLDVNRDIRRLYAGSQDSSIMNVYLGRAAAGATWPPPWQAFSARHPELAAELVVQWQTDSLVNNGLVVRDDVPPSVVGRVANLLFALQNDETGRRLLAAIPLTRFEPADDGTYEPVRRFVAEYRAVVK